MNRISTILQSIINVIGNVTMGTTATTITGAIAEVLGKATTNTTNISTLTTRTTTNTTNISTLTSKTNGIVGTKQYTVTSSGGKTYVHMVSMSAYVVITNSYSVSTTLSGMYIVGVNSASALGITTVKAASDVALADVNDGILRITNNGSVALRVTVITTSGTAV